MHQASMASHTQIWTNQVSASVIKSNLQQIENEMHILIVHIMQMLERTSVYKMFVKDMMLILWT